MCFFPPVDEYHEHNINNCLLILCCPKDESPEKQLYEHHQEMLEKNTERLQEGTENIPLESLDRTQVVNMTRVTDRFMTSLLASMQGGVVELPDDAGSAGAMVCCQPVTFS